MPLQYFAPAIFGDEVRWGTRRAQPTGAASVKSVERSAFAQAGTKAKQGDAAAGGAAARPRIKAAPSGRLAGIFARGHAARGIHKAPADESIRGTVNAGIVVPGEAIFLVVKNRRDGPWARESEF